MNIYSNMQLTGRLSILSILVACALPAHAEVINDGKVWNISTEIRNNLELNKGSTATINDGVELDIIARVGTSDSLKFTNDGTINNNGNISISASEFINNGTVNGGNFKLAYTPESGGSMLTLGDSSSMNNLNKFTVTSAENKIVSEGGSTISVIGNEGFAFNSDDSELYIETKDKVQLDENGKEKIIKGKLKIEGNMDGDKHVGTLTKSGSGELEYSGINNLQNKTQLQGGILTITDRGSIVNGVAMSDGTTLNVNGTSGEISGTGNVKINVGDEKSDVKGHITGDIDVNGGLTAKITGKTKNISATESSDITVNEGSTTENINVAKNSKLVLNGMSKNITSTGNDSESNIAVGAKGQVSSITLAGNSDAKIVINGKVGTTNDVDGKFSGGNIDAKRISDLEINGGETGDINITNTVAPTAADSINILNGGVAGNITTKTDHNIFVDGGKAGDLNIGGKSHISISNTTKGALSSVGDIKTSGDTELVVDSSITGDIDVLGKLIAEVSGDSTPGKEGKTGSILAQGNNSQVVLKSNANTGDITLKGNDSLVVLTSENKNEKTKTGDIKLEGAGALIVSVDENSEAGNITMSKNANKDSWVHVNGKAGNVTFTDGDGWLTGTGTLGDVVLDNTNIRVGTTNDDIDSVGNTLTMDNLTTTQNTKFYVKGSDKDADYLNVNKTADLSKGLTVNAHTPAGFKTDKTKDGKTMYHKIIQSNEMVTKDKLDGETVLAHGDKDDSGFDPNSIYQLDSKDYLFLKTDLVYKTDEDGNENLYLVYTREDVNNGGGNNDGNGGGNNGGNGGGNNDGNGGGNNGGNGGGNNGGNGSGKNPWDEIKDDGTHNQGNTGGGVQVLPDGPVKDAVISAGDKNDTLNALDNLSGEIHSTAKSAAITNSRYVRDAVNNRLVAKAKQTLDTEDYVWLSGWGRDMKIKSDGNAAQTKNKGSGFLMGMDANIGENARIGIAAGYEHANISVNDYRASRAKIDSTNVAIYGGYDTENYNFRGAVAYSDSVLNTNRAIWVADIESTATANYSNGLIQSFIEGSRDFKITDNFTATPYVNLAYIYLKGGAFREKGSEAALHSSGKDHQMGYATLGTVLSYDMPSYRTSLYSRFAWQHAIGSLTPESELLFNDSPSSFNIRGISLDRDTALIGLGVNTELMKDVRFSLGYQGEFGKSLRDHSVNATLNILF